ncbi:Detected protein of unknown function [Hibiscus syriacus]|uniref:AT-hook motif nuclear-localized protein n=1 Tax=Hibiscus syriacus TaxID=106335 RepID=A0A6A3BQ10_HIBSY|nr:Detected protein of unknown function [Hibiscus syriacus]
MVYTHSVPPEVTSASEPARRKRGRPRKHAAAVAPAVGPWRSWVFEEVSVGCIRWGRFKIILLSGSYVRNEIGRITGGLGVCQVIGGVGGPLKAAGPVQVIAGTFTIDNEKDVSAGAKGDASGGKLPSPAGGLGGSRFMMQRRGMHMAPRSTDWRISLDDVELTGKTDQTPQNEDYGRHVRLPFGVRRGRAAPDALTVVENGAAWSMEMGLWKSWSFVQ